MNIVVDHVTKTIHRAVVLQDISLNFESGKVYGLQGENGSGKTMLLRLMCGLIYATEGSVSVNDRRLGKDLDFPESVGVMMLIPNSRKLQMDTLVSVYVRYEEEIELVAIGALSESADKSGRYVQVNIEHRINDELLSKIMQNDRMKKRYFIEDTVRFSDISDLMK